MSAKIKFKFLAGPLTLALCLASLAQAQAPANPAKQRTVTVGGKSYLLTSRLKSILVGDFFYNYNHHQNNSPQNMISTIQRLGAAEGWTVEVTTDGNTVSATKLRGFQVFLANYVSSWASTNGFPTANRSAVQDFVENQGGGVFILHSSGDSKPSSLWPWYYNVAHPVEYAHETSRLTVSAPVFIPAKVKTHPVMDGINFAGKDTVTFAQGEWHMFNHLITEVHPDADVLLAMNGAKCTKGGTGTNCGYALSLINYNPPGGYPASWTFKDKKGTIGYFMEAHDLETMKYMTEPVWDKFFKQFMYYIAGYDSVLVPTGLSKGADLNFAVDASGITFHPSDEAGVFISKPGPHVVSLFDMAGHKVKEITGNKYPVDYDLSPDLRGVRSGTYVLRVTVPGGNKSKRYFVN